MDNKTLMEFKEVVDVIEDDCPEEYGLESKMCPKIERKEIECSECWLQAINEELTKRGMK